MGQGNKTGAGTEQVLQTSQIQFPIFQVNIVQFGPCFSAGLLPRNDIGMVFHDGNDDLITRLEDFLRKMSHPVEASRSTTCKENFPA